MEVFPLIPGTLRLYARVNIMKLLDDWHVMRSDLLEQDCGLRSSTCNFVGREMLGLLLLISTESIPMSTRTDHARIPIISRRQPNFQKVIPAAVPLAG